MTARSLQSTNISIWLWTFKQLSFHLTDIWWSLHSFSLLDRCQQSRLQVPRAQCFLSSWLSEWSKEMGTQTLMHKLNPMTTRASYTTKVPTAGPTVQIYVTTGLWQKHIIDQGSEFSSKYLNFLSSTANGSRWRSFCWTIAGVRSTLICLSFTTGLFLGIHFGFSIGFFGPNAS